MKRKFKTVMVNNYTYINKMNYGLSPQQNELWPLTSTQWTMASHLNSMNIKKTMT